MDSEARESASIHSDAAKWAERTTYTLHNPYTTRDEKIEIESWFQLPLVTATWAYAVCCIFWSNGEFGGGAAYLTAAGAGLLAASLAWFFYSKSVVFTLCMLLRLPVLRWAGPLAIAIWLWLEGSSLQALCVVANQLLVGFPVGLPAFLFNFMLLRKYRMHIKYAFLKHRYGKSYPFEQ